MESYPIKVAFADYDRTRPLLDGRVKAKEVQHFCICHHLFLGVHFKSIAQ